jgi:aminobenzoyl-glutamate utilization protein B
MNTAASRSSAGIAAVAALLSVALAAQPPPASPGATTPSVNPQLDQYKRDVGQEVDGLQEMIQRMNDQVFSFGELGFQEFETTKYLTGILRQNGFTVQENLAGIPTAWMASW